MINETGEGKHGSREGRLCGGEVTQVLKAPHRVGMTRGPEGAAVVGDSEDCDSGGK